MFRQSPVAPRMTSGRAAHPRPSDEAPEPDVVFDEEAATATSPRDLRPVELGPIIRSKIQAPALRPSTLSRQRLLDQLTEATSHRLTLLIAEAGYGKTTLLADFARSTNARVMWYRLDSTDTDVITWSNYLIAAGREWDQDFGEATLRLMSQVAAGGPPTAAFISSVIAEMAPLEPTATLLVLDDFHEVDESEDALGFVRRLIKDAPPWLRLVVSTRRRPQLELARVTAAGDLDELSTDQLRFRR